MSRWLIMLFDEPELLDALVNARTFLVEADEVQILPNGFFSFVRKNAGNGAAPQTILILSDDSVQFMRPEAL